MKEESKMHVGFSKDRESPYTPSSITPPFHSFILSQLHSFILPPLHSSSTPCCTRPPTDCYLHVVVVHVVGRVSVQVVHDHLIGVQSCEQWVSSLVRVRDIIEGGGGEEKLTFN